MRKCSICGKEKDWNTNWGGYWNGYDLCAECYNEHIYTCRCCRGSFLDTKVPRSKETIGGSPVCPQCAKHMLMKCDICGGKDYSMKTMKDGRVVCSGCLDKILGYRHYRQESYPFYAHRKTGNYKSKPTLNGGRYFGIELEMDRARNSERDDDNYYKKTLIEMLEAGNHEVYFEEDCSLGADGAELITYPHTISAFYGIDWEQILRIARESSYRSHDGGNCGLHFHFNKMFFGDTIEEQTENIAKVLVFYNIFWDDLVKFSRRTNPSQWAGKPPIGIDVEHDDAYDTAKKTLIETRAKERAENGSRNRYLAVNLCPEKTVEFRLMRGTLRYETFMATVDFCIQVVLMAKEISWSDVWDYKNWLKWVKPETIEYMKSRDCFRGLYDDSVDSTEITPNSITDNRREDEDYDNDDNYDSDDYDNNDDYDNE